MPRQDTRLESEGAEFLVLGQLLLHRVWAYKTYTNMPGYDLVAVDPDRNRAARIQVKSRWRTGAPGFPIKNFGCDFVVLARLNRGNKAGTAEIGPPEFFVFPAALIRRRFRDDAKWPKAYLKDIPRADSYRDRWDLIVAFLKRRPTRRVSAARTVTPGP